MTNYWVEIRSGVQRSGAPRLVPLAEVGQHTGFRSVVSYDDAVAQLIRERGGTYDLRGQPVYADTLFMDWDGHKPTEFLDWLAGSGLAHSIWDSGNRSVHVHIPLVPIYGPWVCAAMKEWTKRHAPTADTSFLHPGGQYRLPGTYHKRAPGRRKELVAEQGGSPLALQPCQKVEIQSTYWDGGSREKFYTALLSPKGEGHRQPYAWYLATLAAEAGMDFDEAVEKLTWWGLRMCSPPHDPDTMRRQCESAFRRASRRQA
jgi:hypothetical protein